MGHNNLFVLQMDKQIDKLAWAPFTEPRKCSFPGQKGAPAVFVALLMSVCAKPMQAQEHLINHPQFLLF